MLNLSQEQIMQSWDTNDGQHPLVSIRCITYNHEKYIARALDGFLVQKTNFPFEVIVHDDASTDNTADIIREYEVKYPKIIKPIYEKENQFSKRDGSLAKIVNAACKGKYIALCEGDDYWTYPLKLKSQIEFLRNHPDFSMCFHRAEIVYENGFNFCALKCDNIENREYKPAEFLTNWIVPTASIIYKRECLDYEIKGKSRILNGDIFTILKCSALGKIQGFDGCWSAYRVHEGGVTYRQDIQRKRTMKYPAHFECILDNFPEIAPTFIKKRISECYFTRAGIQDSIGKTLHDYIKSFSVSRKAFFGMLARSVRVQIKKFFPSLYTKLKARYGKER